jgi:hypothetical protein
MNYQGWIDASSKTGEKGALFASSDKEPIEFTVGEGQVILGWDQGLITLCTGDKATLTLKPELAGRWDLDRPASSLDRRILFNVPLDATVRFDVDILDVKHEPNLFRDIDTNGDTHLTKEEVQAWHKEDGLVFSDEEFKEIWKSQDVDFDGVISWEEFSGPKGAIKPAAKFVLGEKMEL